MANTVLRAAIAAVGIRPCGDNSCIFGRPEGMGTNGGCHCFERGRPELVKILNRLAGVARALADKLEEQNRAPTNDIGWIEPAIVINSKPLTFAQAMSVRVAVNAFLSEVSDEEYAAELGPIAGGYRMRLSEVLDLMMTFGRERAIDKGGYLG
jgi:hypothetical protein